MGIGSGNIPVTHAADVLPLHELTELCTELCEALLKP